MELERQQEVGARIKELRGPKPQPLIADEVGVTLRAYQEWEAGGGIAWANLQKLAEVFNVSENYLLYGTAEATGPQTQLDRIEKKLDGLLSQLPGYDEKLARLLEGLFEQELEDAVEQDEQPGNESEEDDDGSGETGAG